MTDTLTLLPEGVLDGFLPDEVLALRALLKEVSVKASDPLWGEGEGAKTLYLIIEGRVELSRPTEFPERRVIMGLFGPGSVVGETGFFSGTDSGLKAFALEDTRLATLGREGLDSLFNANPSAHAKLLGGVLRAMAKRLDSSYARMSSVF